MNTNNKSLKLIPVILAFLLSLNAHHTTAQVDVQDSLALVSIFNETNGNSWTNNANWLMGPPVPSWFGISTFGTRVTQIVLPNNSLTDSLPFEINTLTELTFADFNFNNISELDTINPILLHDLITFDVRNNRLDFGDFEKSLPAINAVPNFLMHPQDSVGQPKTLMRSVHDIHTFQVDVGGSMNQYQWFKNNVAIPGATDPTYTLSSLSSIPM